MRLHSLAVFITTGLIMLAACQSSPPTVVYVVVSSTPVEVNSNPTPQSAQIGSQPQSQAITTTPQPTITINTPAPTMTPDIFPTQTVAQVQVAEQVFENGRMFWLQPVSQIWVMIIDEEGRGRWLRYEDTFDENEDVDTDPDIVAPEGKIQPERGFGKLWRENPEVRDALGWAITPEFGYISQYEYHPGGEVVDNIYTIGSGHHILFSLNSEAFRFDEETNSWRLN